MVPQVPAPAPGSFGVVGANLPDGRFILWNGDTVYIQASPGSGIFGAAGNGYQGDPGFLAMSPDGKTALLGAGFSTRLYLYDVENPASYDVSVEITGQTHFAGAYLTDDLVVLDRLTDDFSASELVILDLSGSKSAPIVRTVLTKPPAPDGKQVVLDKPAGSFSSSVRVDPGGTLLYVMDSNVRELRTFLVADILNAFATTTPLDWTADGTLIGSAGDYFSGGVSGFTGAAELVIGGSEGFAQPGGIQLVDAGTGAINQILDPAGTQPFYSVIFNQVTGDIIARTGSGVTYANSGAIADLPASGLAMLALLTMALSAVTVRRLAKSN